MAANSKPNSAPSRPRGRPRSSMVEIGFPGLREFGGYVMEEWLPQLRGKRGIRAYKTMLGTDATCAAMSTAWKMAVKQVKWRVEAGGPTDADTKAAEHVSNCLFNWLDEAWHEKMTEITTFGDMGFSAFEKVFDKRSDGTIYWRKWAFRPQETILKWNWDMDESSSTYLELTDMVQQVWLPGSKLVYIPVDKCIIFSYNATKGNPEGVSLLRGVYMAWYNKHKLELIELIGIERNLAGLPDVKIPAENFEKKNQPVLNKYLEIAKKVHRNEDMAFITPSDPWPGTSIPMYNVGLVGGQQLTTRGTGLPTIQPIARYQAEIARGFLADFMLLPAGGPGSYALSSNKSSFFVMFIENICNFIAEVINKQAIPELCDLNNFGTLTDYPKLVHGKVARPEISDIGKLLANLLKAGASVFPNDPLLNAIYEDAGLPKIPESEENEELAEDEAIESPTDEPSEDAAIAAAQIAAAAALAQQKTAAQSATAPPQQTQPAPPRGRNPARAPASGKTPPPGTKPSGATRRNR